MHDVSYIDHGLAPCHLGGSRSALFPLLIEVGAGNLIVICDFHLSVYIVQCERPLYGQKPSTDTLGMIVSPWACEDPRHRAHPLGPQGHPCGNGLLNKLIDIFKGKVAAGFCYIVQTCCSSP
jgi:hypothetical protein